MSTPTLRAGIMHNARLIVDKEKVIKNKYNSNRNPQEVLKDLKLEDDDVLVVMKKDQWGEL